LVLVVSPWYPFWDHNFFGLEVPSLGSLLANPFVRGAVSGVGAITLVAGLIELAGIFVMRARADAPDGNAQT
jgi:hypothetical protein